MPGTHTHRLLRLAPLLLAALVLIIACSSLTRQGLDWWRQVHAPAPEDVATSSTADQSAPDLATIESLFGTPAATASTPRKTSLSLKLLGSFVNADPSRSSAIIQSGSGQPKRFLAGDKLNNSVSVHAVYRDHVELQSGGRLESLYFPENKAIQRVLPTEEPPAAPDPGGTGAEDDVDVDLDAEGLHLLNPDAPEPTP